MRDLTLASVLTASALLVKQTGAVAVNPLPKPANITWGNSGCFSVGSIKLDGPDNKLLSDAFSRMTKTVTDLKWIPAGVEAPIRSFEPFPGKATKKKSKREYPSGSAGNCTGTISTVKVDIANTNAQL